MKSKLGEPHSLFSSPDIPHCLRPVDRGPEVDGPSPESACSCPMIFWMHRHWNEWPLWIVC